MTVSRVANRAILRLAIPALATLAIDPLLTLIDTVFVARVGVVELAALGVDTAVLGFVFFGFNFLAYATTPLVAQALGRGDPAGARRWVGDALVLAVVLGLAASAIVLVLAPWFVELMGAGEEVAGPAVSPGSSRIQPSRPGRVPAPVQVTSPAVVSSSSMAGE